MKRYLDESLSAQERAEALVDELRELCGEENVVVK